MLDEGFPVCFFAFRSDAGPCSGQLVAAHLIPRQLLKREFRYGVVFEDDAWRALSRTEDRYDLPWRSVDDLISDPRSFVPCCGGLQGNGGHHGAFDGLRLRIPRDELPPGVEAFAAELGLAWYLDRIYGPLDEGVHVGTMAEDD